MKTVTLAIVTAIVAGVAFGTLTATGVWKLDDFGNNASLSTQALSATEKGGLIGTVHYILKDKDGNIKYETVMHNTIVDAGEDMLQNAFSGGIAAADAIKVVCIGTGGATAVNEAAGTGVGLVTAAAGATITTEDGCKTDASVTLGTQTGTTAQTVEIDATFIGNTDMDPDLSISEAVLADTDPAAVGSAQDPADTDTFSRQTFTGITVASGDSLTVKWTISGFSD
jgi:hypothetical protein